MALQYLMIFPVPVFSQWNIESIRAIVQYDNNILAEECTGKKIVETCQYVDIIIDFCNEMDEIEKEP